MVKTEDDLLRVVDLGGTPSTSQPPYKGSSRSRVSELLRHPERGLQRHELGGDGPGIVMAHDFSRSEADVVAAPDALALGKTDSIALYNLLGEGLRRLSFQRGSRVGALLRVVRLEPHEGRGAGRSSARERRAGTRGYRTGKGSGRYESQGLVASPGRQMAERTSAPEPKL